GSSWSSASSRLASDDVPPIGSNPTPGDGASSWARRDASVVDFFHSVLSFAPVVSMERDGERARGSLLCLVVVGGRRRLGLRLDAPGQRAGRSAETRARTSPRAELVGPRPVVDLLAGRVLPRGRREEELPVLGPADDHPFR